MGRKVKGKHRNTRTPNASLIVVNDSIKIGLKYSIDEDIVNFLILFFLVIHSEVKKTQTEFDY